MRTTRHGLRALALWLILTPAAVLGQEPPPALTAPVNDFADVVDAESEREMDRRIRLLQQATGDVVAVATVQTFKPYATIDEYAVRMFENGGRGIGQKGKDNGVLIVVAVEDRQVRAEVGYDLEEFITDGFAGETIRQVMTPEFRRGEYGRGLLAGTTGIINRIAERRGVTLEGMPQPRPRVGVPTRIPAFLPFLLFWLILLALSSRRRRRRRRWGGPWSGWNSGVGPFGGGSFGGGFGGFGGGGFGGGGGGFGGFGGGRSGGGGASGGW